MLKIKIYGTESPSYQLVKTKLKSFMDNASIVYDLQEVTKISEIMEDNIVSVPAVKVNDDLLFEIKPNGSYNASLREAIQSILRLQNYGTMTKIIVPTDFSEASLNAYNFAHRLAKHLPGVIKLTHVYYPTSADVNQIVVVNDEVEKIHREKLEEYVKSFNQDWIGNFVEEPMVEGIFRVGFPVMELKELSKEKDTVLVMGTTGEGGAFKKVFGSISLDMIEKSNCPLFLIPPDAGASQINKVTFLSEDLNQDAAHLKVVLGLCTGGNTRLSIVHFKKQDNSKFDETSIRAIVDTYMNGTPYDVEIISNVDVFDGVRDIVTRDVNELVVLSTKHRNIFQNLFHKSVTEFAALNAISPLLILTDKV
ncbi:MAG: universal stress protein [Chitinophagales bacterium]|nr:universal stress protein [Chitinophagales bacterium]